MLRGPGLDLKDEVEKGDAEKDVGVDHDPEGPEDACAMHARRVFVKWHVCYPS